MVFYELQYSGKNHGFAFKCDWYNVQHEGRGYRTYEYGITSVHRGQSLNSNELFVLDSQVEQVFYVPEPRNKDWLVVIKTEPHDLYNMPEIEVDEDTLDQGDDEPVQQDEIEDPGCILWSSRQIKNLCLATNDFMVERGADVAKWVKREMENRKQQKQQEK